MGNSQGPCERSLRRCTVARGGREGRVPREGRQPAACLGRGHARRLCAPSRRHRSAGRVPREGRHPAACLGVVGMLDDRERYNQFRNYRTFSPAAHVPSAASVSCLFRAPLRRAYICTSGKNEYGPREHAEGLNK